MTDVTIRYDDHEILIDSNYVLWCNCEHEAHDIDQFVFDIRDYIRDKFKERQDESTKE